jgi:uncharacterized protein (TIGR01777 family)
MKIAFTGATGFIGRAAVARLEAGGHSVIRLSRRDDVPALSRALAGADAVVNLAGEPVAEGRWTPAKKAAIRDSRVLGTRKLVQALALLSPEARPHALVSGSAIGYYGDRGDETLDESSAPGEDFLAGVCREWEAEAEAASKLGVRVVVLRTGVVLGRGGGALQKMKPVVLGSGRQWISWIHLDDIARFIEQALGSDTYSGPYNLTAPEPARNREFTRVLARVQGWLWAPTVPALAIRLALGELSSALLGSCRAVPRKALTAGFVFAYSELEAALTEATASF